MAASPVSRLMDGCYLQTRIVCEKIGEQEADEEDEDVGAEGQEDRVSGSVLEPGWRRGWETQDRRL